MNRIFLLFLITSSSLLSAQNEYPLYRALAGVPAFDSAYVSMWGDYGVEANHLPQSFLNKFIFGGSIDASLKDRTFAALGGQNSLFFQSSYGASWTSGMRSAGPGYRRMGLAIAREHRTALRFPAELFALAFYGNATAENSGEAFGPAKGYLYAGNRIAAWIERGNRDTRHPWSLRYGASLMQINRFWKLDLPSGQVKTTPFSNETLLDTELDIYFSDTLNNAAFGTDGWGLTADFDFSIDWKGWKWHASLRDLGILLASDKAIHLSRHASKYYEGVDIATAFGNDGSFSFSFEEDSLFSTLDVNVENTSFRMISPALISVFTQRRLGRWDMSFGLRYRYLSYPLPLFHASVGYEDKAVGMHYWAILYYGGSGSPNLGMGLRKTLGKKAFVYLGSDHLLSPLFSNNLGGLSSFLRLSLKL